uniref:Uncharacterized protein n=1 Tax=uncultured prokaryote TaxID=198431 RepID=A0A0H5Q4L6_9ZZZZ|nr:hypothetical protein [uncultured prokaryote]
MLNAHKYKYKGIACACDCEPSHSARLPLFSIASRLGTPTQTLKTTVIKQKGAVIREKKDFRSVERPFAHRHSLCNTPKHPINTEKMKSVLTTPLFKGMFVQKKMP